MAGGSAQQPELHRHGLSVHAHASAGPHRHLLRPWRSQAAERPHDQSHEHEHEHEHSREHGHSHVSLAVIASAVVVAVGLPLADPLIGLGITLVILRITWQSWQTVSAGPRHEH